MPEADNSGCDPNWRYIAGMGNERCGTCALLEQTLAEAETAWAAAQYPLSIDPAGALDEGEVRRLNAAERCTRLQVGLARLELNRHRLTHRRVAWAGA
jgi:hypothetical protein